MDRCAYRRGFRRCAHTWQRRTRRKKGPCVGDLRSIECVIRAGHFPWLPVCGRCWTRLLGVGSSCSSTGHPGRCDAGNCSPCSTVAALVARADSSPSPSYRGSQCWCHIPWSKRIGTGATGYQCCQRHGQRCDELGPLDCRFPQWIHCRLAPIHGDLGGGFGIRFGDGDLGSGLSSDQNTSRPSFLVSACGHSRFPSGMASVPPLSRSYCGDVRQPALESGGVAGTWGSPGGRNCNSS